MKKSIKLFLFISVVCAEFSVGSVVHAEDWKGAPEESVLSLGAMAGLGVIDATSGFTIFGTLSKKIVNHGFVPDITNSVSVEGGFGPVILSSGTATAYSIHLRWDFEKDKDWTLFAMGGLGGNVLNGRGEFFPRFGIGAFYKMSGPLNARFEISHEAIAAGINVPFY
ncbi:MAG: hypothetical protein ABIQ95_11600 [Bdellovibrionia bacterium]